MSVNFLSKTVISVLVTLQRIKIVLLHTEGVRERIFGGGVYGTLFLFIIIKLTSNTINTNSCR